MSSNSLAGRVTNKMHHNDHCAQMLGIEILVSNSDTSQLKMQVKQQHLNGFASIHGGMLASLADTAFAHACNSDNSLTVASGFSIDFIRPEKEGDTLIATAKKQSRGKLTGVYEVLIHNQDDKLVAIFSGKSFDLKQPVVLD